MAKPRWSRQEGAEHRAPIAQADVGPAEHGPQRPGEKAAVEVASEFVRPARPDGGGGARRGLCSGHRIGHLAILDSARTAW